VFLHLANGNGVAVGSFDHNRSIPYAFANDPALAEFSCLPIKTRSPGESRFDIAPSIAPVPELANKNDVIPRVEIVAKVIERLAHQRTEGIRAMVQRHRQGAELRFIRSGVGPA